MTLLQLALALLMAAQQPNVPQALRNEAIMVTTQALQYSETPQYNTPMDTQPVQVLTEPTVMTNTPAFGSTNAPQATPSAILLANGSSSVSVAKGTQVVLSFEIHGFPSTDNQNSPCGFSGFGNINNPRTSFTVMDLKTGDYVGTINWLANASTTLTIDCRDARNNPTTSSVEIQIN